MALRTVAAVRCCARPAVTRSFASAAKGATAAGEEHFPPLKLYGIPARYANATYTAASKAGQLDLVQRDLDAFQHLITSNVNFKAYLTNPTVSRSAKVDMVDKAFDAKSKTSAVTKNLLLIMAGNNRLGVADKVIDAFTRMLKAKKGEVDAIVTTAEPLTPQQEKSLAAGLKAQVGEGKKVVLKTEVNPSLVGGLTVQIGDKFMDLSISSKIASMKLKALYIILRANQGMWISRGFMTGRLLPEALRALGLGGIEATGVAKWVVTPGGID